MATIVTIGDALPDYMKSDYSETVLNVPLEEAVKIAVYDEPPTSNLSEDDIADIVEIFGQYESEGGPDADAGGSAYWNKSPDENSAYWNKTTMNTMDTLATIVTIGDALPDYMKADYSETVLNVPLEEAVKIAVYDEPPTSNLSEDDIDDIVEIFGQYQSEGGPDANAGGSAYWNKSPDENSAYWNKS
jgi:hypothetical protein